MLKHIKNISTIQCVYWNKDTNCQESTDTLNYDAKNTWDEKNDKWILSQIKTIFPQEQMTCFWKFWEDNSLQNTVMLGRVVGKKKKKMLQDNWVES